MIVGVATSTRQVSNLPYKRKGHQPRRSINEDDGHGMRPSGVADIAVDVSIDELENFGPAQRYAVTLPSYQ